MPSIQHVSLTAAALAAVAALAAPSTVGSKSATAPPASHASRIVLATEKCRYGIRRPKLVILACGDGGIWLRDLRWRRWGGPVAVGYGTYGYKLCEPDCATGGFREIAATVRFHRRRECPDRTHLYYRRVTVIEGSGARHGWGIPCPY